MPSPRLKAPTHLRPPTRKWWLAVVRDWSLEAHHIRLLTLACEAFDRGEEARQILKKAGAYYRDRFGQPKEHPALAVERDSRIAFARLLRELDLDTEAGPAVSRPPRRGRTV